MNKALSQNTPRMSSPEWEAARDEARDLDKYSANWDGADADPVPLELIGTTLLLLKDLERQTYPAPDLVYPLADGSIMIEWHYQNGAVQVANVRRRTIDVFTMDENGVTSPPLHFNRSDYDYIEKLSDSTSTDDDAFEYYFAA